MKKALMAMVLLFVLTIVLGGCGAEPGVSKTPTAYSVLNDNGDVVQYLNEEHEEVAKILEVVTGWQKAMNNRSFETITGDEEYGYYSESLLGLLNADGDKEKTVNMYVGAEIISSHIGIEDLVMSFSSDYSVCNVWFTSKTKIISANDGYYKTRGTKSGDTMLNAVMLRLQKTNSVWEIEAMSSEAPTYVD